MLAAFWTLVALPALSAAAARWHTNATYVNDNSSVAADPYVRWDAGTGQYWAYSTEGADDGWYYGVYHSPDLTTWTKVPGGAIKNDSANIWAQDWWWAPECYHNEKTGWYFLFHAGRYTSPKQVAQYFKYPDFEEASKIGVAVSRSPAGPFVEIAPNPIDYWPFDPLYHDINLLMSPPYLVPPSSPSVGNTSSLGTYIPSIDPNVIFDDDGSIWLFFSRNAYRNWVWSDEFDRYIEESNIYAVRLDDAWWNDPHAKTLPSVHASFKDVHKNQPEGWVTSVNASFPGPTRKDGFVPVISYKLQPQAWENAHVNDYVASMGTLKNRRWSEGSTTIKRYDSAGDPVYFLTYSANNYESPDYGVGYAYAHSVSGPYYKSGSNPILSQDASRGIYSTGHGSIVASSANPNELYYPHHARPDPAADRYLYTTRLFVEPDTLALTFGPGAGDLRIPSGVAPFAVAASPVKSTGAESSARAWNVSVRAAGGAPFDLAHPQNRLATALDPPVPGAVVSVNGSVVHVSGLGAGTEATLRLSYQRARANVTAPWADVVQFAGAVQAGAAVGVSITL